MYQIVLLIHVVIAIALIILVLIQHGKGADIGAAFGSGASQTVFGSQGSGSFLMKLTGSLAAGFFATSLFLGYIVSSQMKQHATVDLAIPQTTTVKLPAPSVPKPATQHTAPTKKTP